MKRPARKPPSCSAAALHPAPTTSFTGSAESSGASVVNLAPIMLHPEVGRWTGGGKVTLEYLATKEGLEIVGGLVDEGPDESFVSMSVEDGKGEAGGEARNLNVWSAIGEACLGDVPICRFLHSCTRSLLSNE